MAEKQRLDQLLVSKGMAPSRQRAQALIMAGKVLVNTEPINKPGTQVPIACTLAIKGDDLAYVSRGGLKLEAALKDYGVTVQNYVCLDVGASTGGFTDCLLQNGAKHVYAVDVGYGQLAWSLRQDPRVTTIERTNIRHMPISVLPQLVDLITIDTSFISLKIVIPAVLKFLKPTGQIIALIKPQFEVGKAKVGKGGVVKDKALHDEVIDILIQNIKKLNLNHRPPIPSPIKGPKGNQEYLIHLSFTEIEH